MMKIIDMPINFDPAKKKDKSRLKAILSDKVKDYGNEPYFLKKAKESEELLLKYGFPKEFLDKK